MKRRFTFRLARLLRVRESEERVARATWGSAEGAAAAAREQEERSAQGVRSARAALRIRPGQGTIDPVETLAGMAAIDGLEERQRGLRELARTRDAQAEELLGAWKERRRRAMALVRLEARARERHRRELARHEELEREDALRGRPSAREGPPGGEPR